MPRSSLPSTKKPLTLGSRLFLFLVLWFLLFSGYSAFFIFQDPTADSALQWQMAFGALMNNFFILVGLRLIFWLIQFLGETITRICLVVVFGVSVPLVVIDFFVFQQFKFHINSFVLKVMLQPNIFETLGLGWATGATFLVVLAVGLVMSEAIWRATGSRRVDFLRRLFNGRWKQLGICLLIVLATLADKTLFAWQLYQAKSEFYLTAQRIPFYIIVRMGETFENLGFEKPKSDILGETQRSQLIRYPLNPIEFPPAQATYPNIIFILSERMRDDIISPEVTPNIQRHIHCCFTQYQNHYSISNDTAQSLFGLFFSLPSSYMVSFSYAKITPLFFEVLEKRNYQIELLAKQDLGFYWRETFRKVQNQVRDRFSSESEMIDAALDILAERKTQNPPRPLFLLVFHDAPHDYQFSHEDYQKFQPDDYMPLFDPSDPEDRLKAANQFKNAFNYVDHEAGRLLDALQSEGYFENSIIMITGDHGHEQYEHGHWGHTSAFTKEQTKVHFSIHTPQQTHHEKSNQLTSHMDIVPTLLEEMGESLPLEQFTVGTPLFSPEPREFIIMDGQANRVFFDGRVKIDSTPFEGIAHYRVVDEDDEPLANPDEVLEQYTPLLLKMFEKLGRFYQ